MGLTLNCDMGESYGNWSFGDDTGIMPYIDCANIACGFHASDPMTMARTVELALSHGKKIGAHPSLPDREGFGRREMKLLPEELRAAFIYQIGALQGFVKANGSTLNHVKPHGVIYGMAARDIKTAVAIAEAVAVFGLPLFGMAGTEHEAAAKKVGVPFIGEFFADLQYGPQGELIIPRHHSPSDVGAAAERLSSAIETGKVTANDGTLLDLVFSTICIHSDSSNASELAKSLRRVLDVSRRS